MTGHNIQESRSSASSESDDVSNDAEWLDVESDEEAVAIVSLLDAQTFPTVTEMLAHCKKQHDFDFVAILRRLQLEFHGAVKLVNFIRGRVQQQQPVPKDISLADIADDAYLKPVLENDALIFSLDEILVEAEESRGSAEVDTKDDAEGITELDIAESSSSRNKALEAELESVRSQFASYRLAVEETLDRRWGDDAKPAPSAPPKLSGSDSYFESYATNEIHELMLKDTVRTDAYRDFIYGNKNLFKDKIVLDIGCGTGILSMFCAKAGAKRVIAVDRSDIIAKAIENVYFNGLSDTITCLRGAIEDVILPVDQVDIIVSEWMGYCLLYEAMLPSVLYARDKYLKPGGLLAPSSATMWIAPVADPEFVSEHISYWRDVYGFDMKTMQEGIYDEARIQVTPKSVLCGDAFPFKTFDLRSVRAEDLVFTEQWDSNLTQDIDALDGFVIWFDNFFATSADEPMPGARTTPETFVRQKQGNVAFTTGPFGKETHWKQGVLLAPPGPSPTAISAPCKVSGKVKFSIPEDNARALTINVAWSVGSGAEKNRSWKLK